MVFFFFFLGGGGGGGGFITACIKPISITRKDMHIHPCISSHTHAQGNYGGKVKDIDSPTLAVFGPIRFLPGMKSKREFKSMLNL